MSDQKVEPIAVTVQDAQTSNPSTVAKTESPNEQPADSTLVTVRTQTLQAVVSYQDTVIADLERKVEKTRSKVERFEDPPPFLPQHPMSVLHPHNPAAAMAAASAAQTAIHPCSTNAAPTTNPLGAASQPLPPHNPGVAAAMAVAAARHPPASGALLAQYPFMFPSPDHAAMAAFMGGVISPLVPAPQTHPQPPPVSQPPQNSNCPDDNEKKQTRYWTPDEHQRFLAAVRAYGPKNYGQISEYVGTRSAKQVRTHAQKYQKKLEREEVKEARRRNEHGVTGSTVGAAAAAAVAAAARAAIHGNVPGAMPTNPIHANPVPTAGRAGPTSSSSRKNFSHSDHQDEQDRRATSVDGSSSTNEVSGARRNGNDSNSVGDDENNLAAAAAAAAAVAAEAANLGGGILSQGQGSSLMVQISGLPEDAGKERSGRDGASETGNNVKSDTKHDVDNSTDDNSQARLDTKQDLPAESDKDGDSKMTTVTTATTATAKSKGISKDFGNSKDSNEGCKQNGQDKQAPTDGTNGSEGVTPRQSDSKTDERDCEAAVQIRLTTDGESNTESWNKGDCAGGMKSQSDPQTALAKEKWSPNDGKIADAKDNLGRSTKEQCSKLQADVSVEKEDQARVDKSAESVHVGTTLINEIDMQTSDPTSGQIVQIKDDDCKKLDNSKLGEDKESALAKSTEMHHCGQNSGERMGSQGKRENGKTLGGGEGGKVQNGPRKEYEIEGNKDAQETVAKAGDEIGTKTNEESPGSLDDKEEAFSTGGRKRRLEDEVENGSADTKRAKVEGGE